MTVRTESKGPVTTIVLDRPEVRNAVDGPTVRLPRLVGLSVALDMILTGRAVSADEARRIGLANRIVPRGTAREVAESLAAEIAAFPQTCMREDRLSAHEQFSMPLPDAL